MKSVTGDDVKAAMVAAGIAAVDHHDCGGCGYMTKYLVRDGELYFDPGCECGRLCAPERVPFQDAADWINMQSDEAVRRSLAERFGITRD